MLHVHAHAHAHAIWLVIDAFYYTWKAGHAHLSPIGCEAGDGGGGESPEPTSPEPGEGGEPPEPASLGPSGSGDEAALCEAGRGEGGCGGAGECSGDTS